MLLRETIANTWKYFNTFLALLLFIINDINFHIFSFLKNYKVSHIQARSATPPKFLLKASRGVNQPKDFLGVVL